MRRALILLFGILGLFGCGDDPLHAGKRESLTQSELDSLPSDELGRRVALQLHLTVADDPDLNRRFGYNERRDRYGLYLQGRGYRDGEGLCRRDVLRVRYGLRSRIDQPAMAQGFEAEATFARPKDYPGVVDCADSRLVFFRADPPPYVRGEETVRRVMKLFDRARSSPTEGAILCVGKTGKPLDCRATLAALPVSHIRKVLDCAPEAGGLCGMLYLDDWTLTINSRADGAIATIRLVVMPNL